MNNDVNNILSMSRLLEVRLDSTNLRIFEVVKASNRGPAFWRQRKLVEAQELIALSQISNRVNILLLDLSDSLRVCIDLKVPVASRPDPKGDIVFHNFARVGITYPAEILRCSQSGTSLACILNPRNVFHPNVLHDESQVICLGLKLEAGIPLREIILKIYTALSMQNISVELDPKNSSGVLCPEASLWWQQHVDRLPLSNETFLV